MKSSLMRPFLLFVVAFTTTATAEFHSLRATSRQRQNDDIAHDTVVREQHLPPSTGDEVALRKRRLQHADGSPRSPEDYPLTTSPFSHRVMCYGDALTEGVQGKDLARIPYAPILQRYLQQELKKEKFRQTVRVSFIGRDHMAAEDMRKGIHGDIGLISHIRRVGSQVVIIWAGMVDIVERKHDDRGKLQKDLLHDITHMHEMAWLELDVRFTVAMAIPIPPKAKKQQAQLIRDVNYGLEEWAGHHNNRVRFVPFPEEASKKWSTNELHLNAKGYEEVAKTLKPVVLDLLLKPYRVFVYGDSVTHGTVVGGENETGPYPYRRFMERQLLKQIPNVVTTDMGLPGRRAVSSLNMLDSAPFGFLYGIGQAGGKTPSVYSWDKEDEDAGLELVDLVVVQLGSSDLTIEKNDHSIVTSLIGLHQAATGQAKVRHTVNIGIPPSRLQQEHPAKGDLAQKINDRMSEIPSSSVSHLPFPFEYNEDDDNAKLWSKDGFHPSRRGYKLLGESLAPLVTSKLLGYQKRVFCFGDAYTSGTTRSGSPHPYPNILDVWWKDVSVSHMGSFHEAKTAVRMVDELNREHGLRSLLKETSTDMDVVVITAGTWDVFAQDDTKAAAIFESIRTLHNTALDNGAKHTIVVGIPEAVFRDSSKWVLNKAAAVNLRLRNYAKNHDQKVTMVDWPIDTVPSEGDDDSSFWSLDGLHLSRNGYDEFAAKVGPVIRSVL